MIVIRLIGLCLFGSHTLRSPRDRILRKTLRCSCGVCFLCGAFCLFGFRYFRIVFRCFFGIRFFRSILRLHSGFCRNVRFLRLCFRVRFFRSVFRLFRFRFRRFFHSIRFRRIVFRFAEIRFFNRMLLRLCRRILWQSNAAGFLRRRLRGRFLCPDRDLCLSVYILL